MTSPTERTTVVVDGYTRFCLTAIAVLLTVLIVALWASAPSGVPAAQAAPEVKVNTSETSGIGNPAAQRQAVQQAIEQGNRTLDKIYDHLQNGKLQVVIVEAPKDHAVPAPEKK